MSAALASAVQPLPPSGEILNTQELNRQVMTGQYGTMFLARGFAGVKNPTVIWDEMITDRQVAYHYYRELEEKDDSVGNVLDKLKRSVLRRPWQITPFDDSSAAHQITDFINAQFSRFNFQRAMESLLDAAGYGVAISEIIYDVRPGEIGISDIHDCPQELFTFGPTFLPQIGPLRYLRDIGDVINGGEIVPEEKFAIFTYRPRSRNRRGRPLLRAVFWPSWFKRNMLRFWLRLGEKGPGTAVVRYSNGGDDDEKNKALAAAEAVIENVAVAVPENFDIVTDLLTKSRAQNPSLYQSLVDRMDYAIARRILGQTLTSFGGEDKSGTQALGEVHKEVEDETSIELARSLEEIVNSQLVNRLVLWNFGPNAPVPTFSFEKDDEDDLGKRVLIDKNLQSMGLQIPRNYALEKYQVPEVGPKDKALVPLPSSGPSSLSLGGGTPDPGADFSDNARIQKDTEDLRRLMSQFRTEGFDAYAQRVRELADAVLGGSL